MIDAPIQQNLGRAKNALQAFLIQKLYIPKVYLDADWNGVRVDVLAIDRDGTGDVHAVRIVPPQGRFIEDGGMVKIGKKVFDSVKELKSLPSHYQYVAVVSDDPDTRRFSPADLILQESFAEDGVGRVGILYVDFTIEPPVEVKLKAERFRSSKEIIELADRYVADHTANWEVRE
ncbi:MAG TPA: hypothetical protein VG225_09075 [Terracidiphilus sp.]|jgi:hypothetical protein|nr:hypothetical protein [Terracidiphilus sp.]